MKKYIVIGAGISGLAVANLLQERGEEVVVFERESRPGGMIKCDIVNGCLFHRTGGHVFNTKRKDVYDWFWSFFDKEKDFKMIDRNSVVAFDEKTIIPYPIENHIYCFDSDVQKSILTDLLKISRGHHIPNNFEDFLKYRFGETLYKYYFQPYNYKIWKKDLTKVPLSWLEGKLPMPTVEEILFNNINHIEERTFVHSSFYYPQKGGSQFIADRLSNNLIIKYDSPVRSIEKKNNKLYVNGEECDRVIYSGNIKLLPEILHMNYFTKEIESLEAHGTTSVFCEIDNNPFSWVYLPNRNHDSHRIICTGNFSENNNDNNMMTATVEFTDYLSIDKIEYNLNKILLNPRYITHNYEKYTYPIQDRNTRDLITAIKTKLSEFGIYLVGRFAEWEYFNMDVAIGAAMDLVKKLSK